MESFEKRRLIFPVTREEWLRVGVIAVTLLAAAWIGLHPMGKTSLLLGAGLAGVMAFFILGQYMLWGILVIIPASFFLKILIPTGTSVYLRPAFLVVLLMTVVWLVRNIVVVKKIFPIASPVNRPVAVFIAACTVGLIGGFLPWNPMISDRPSLNAQISGYLLYVLSIAALLLAINAMRSLRLIKIYTWVYVSMGVFYLLCMVIPWSYSFISKYFILEQKGSSTYWIMIAVLPLSQALFNHSLNRWLRVVLAIVPLISLSFSLLKSPSWISGWLPALLAVGILVWLRNWRLGVAATVVFGLFMLAWFPGYYAGHIATADQEWSTFTRYATWPVVWELFKLNPITGLGSAVYPFYTGFYNYLGYFIRFNTHNNYFDIVLQYGILGLGAFGWLVATIFWTGWKARRQSAEAAIKQDGFNAAFSNAVLAGFTASLASGVMADWFLPLL